MITCHASLERYCGIFSKTRMVFVLANYYPAHISQYVQPFFSGLPMLMKDKCLYSSNKNPSEIIWWILSSYSYSLFLQATVNAGRQGLAVVYNV